MYVRKRYDLAKLSPLIWRNKHKYWNILSVIVVCDYKQNYDFICIFHLNTERYEHLYKFVNIRRFDLLIYVISQVQYSCLLLLCMYIVRRLREFWEIWRAIVCNRLFPVWLDPSVKYRYVRRNMILWTFLAYIATHYVIESKRLTLVSGGQCWIIGYRVDVRYVRHISGVSRQLRR